MAGNYLKMAKNLSKSEESLIKGLTPAEDRLLRMVSKSEKAIPTHSAAGIALAKRTNWNIANNPRFANLGLETSRIPKRVTGVKANAKYTVAPTNRLNKKQHGKPSAIVRQQPMEVTTEVVRSPYGEIPVQVASGPTKGRWTKEWNMPDKDVKVISYERPHVSESDISLISSPRSRQYAEPTHFEPYVEQPYFENNWNRSFDDGLYELGAASGLGLTLGSLLI